MYDNNWYQNINKPPLNPPSWVFPIAWGILYALIFISIIFYLNSKWRVYGIILFSIQLFLNLIWTTIFFKLKLICFSLLELIILIFVVLLTYREFIKSSKWAAYLLIPYILWLLFALYLNAYICFNN